MKQFFELMQMSVGRRAKLSFAPTTEDWRSLFTVAYRQSLLGIFADAISRLPSDKRPPRKPFVRLCSHVADIEDANKHFFTKCGLATAMLAAEGYDCCVLKGQGTALLYPAPLLRQSGDIDIWVAPKQKGQGASLEDSIYNYARTKGDVKDACYHHLSLRISMRQSADGGVQSMESDIPTEAVELHYRPSFMFSPIANRRMQRWFDKQRPIMCSHSVTAPATLCEGGATSLFSAPTPAFCIVYALTHIMRHLFDEGIGLRQLLDYYYILMAFNDEADEQMRDETVATLHRFGLYRMASAVMYVLHVVFALPDGEMLVAMNTRTGQFLLDEIMLAGNFGQYDDRHSIPADESPFRKFIRKQRRGLRLCCHFPSEALWQPYFRIWHRFWRLRHGFIKSLRED